MGRRGKKTQLAWKRLEEESERLRDRYAVFDSYERGSRDVSQYRNGYYERDFMTRFGTIRLRIARARGKSFLPGAMEKFQRRAPELAMLARIADHPIRQIQNLLPCNLAPSLQIHASEAA